MTHVTAVHPELRPKSQRWRAGRLLDSTHPSTGCEGRAVTNDQRQLYWKQNLRIVAMLLAIWFVVSYVFGILMADWLNNIQFFGFKLGFWFAQQGSIYIFVILIFAYVSIMNKVDRTHDVHED
jgi:putative solute:sodium symporter small subunit